MREELGSVLPRLPSELDPNQCEAVFRDIDAVPTGRCVDVARRTLDWSVAADAIEALWLKLLDQRALQNGSTERNLNAKARAAV
jgi:hypothetical protein